MEPKEKYGASGVAGHRVTIILLNWNGWADTLECLDSVLHSEYREFDVVVVDNGSSDKSVNKISKWAESRFDEGHIEVIKGEQVSVGSVRMGKSLTAPEQSAGGLSTSQNLREKVEGVTFSLVLASENLGFAGGCNLGIRHALKSNAAYIWLLNNDTTIEASALGQLVQFLNNHSDFDGVTSQIRYFWDRNVIWNCGGELTWYGSNRYYYSNAKVSEVPSDRWNPVTFITGCSLLLRRSLLMDVGLLSDKFFFGEEDLEFCFRLRKNHRRLACNYRSIVYHKVSASTGGQARKPTLGDVYIQFLNRFINMRNQFPALVWHVWRFGVLFYIFPVMLLRHRFPLSACFKVIAALLQDSLLKTRVTRDDFVSAPIKFNHKAG